MTNPRVPTDYIIAHQKDRARIPAELPWQQSLIDTFKDLVAMHRKASRIPEGHKLYIQLSRSFLGRLAEHTEEIDLWLQQNNVTIVPIDDHEEYR